MKRVVQMEAQIATIWKKTFKIKALGGCVKCLTENLYTGLDGAFKGCFCCFGQVVC
jgi:hypothetical protein